MKKIVIWIAIVVIIGAAGFTVYNYNNNLAKEKAQKEKLAQEKKAEEEKKSEEEKKKTEEEKKTAEETKDKEEEKVPAPDFKLKDLKGNEVSLSDYKGKKVFLNFWASWCPPCRAEMPDMEKLYQETKDTDLVILAVNLGEDRATASKFVRDNKLNFSILLDDTTAISMKYNVASIPTSYFIDKEGNVSSRSIGMMTLDQMKENIDAIK